MNKRAIFAAVAAVVVTGAEARSFEVSAWRGETVAARVEDYAELGRTPEGMKIRQGVLMSVKYAPAVKSLQRLEVCDRVKWTTREEGPRVVEIAVDENCRPGVYACGAMNIRVVDRVLPPPSKWRFFLDLWQHPFACARMARAKPFSNRHYAAMKPVYELLATAGQKALTIPIVDQPWDHQCFDAYESLIGRVKKADGSWVYDYAEFDRYVEFGRKCGIGPYIACYTMCPWEYVVRWQNEKGETESVKAVPGTREFEEFWGPFLVDFTRHLNEKGWFKETLIAMDERSPEDVQNIARFIQLKSPGMKISMAGNRNPDDFDGVTIDVYSQVLRPRRGGKSGHCVDEAFLKTAAERRRKGYFTTHYVCCSPAYPNTFMDSGDGEAFWNGAYPAFAGLDGFLRWAWNSWPQNPEKDATYWAWRSGDTFLCYPNGEPSWRFLELRNGIAAAEKVWILRDQGLFTEEIEKLNQSGFDPTAANQNKTPFVKVRQQVIDLVNR